MKPNISDVSRVVKSTGIKIKIQQLFQTTHRKWKCEKYAIYIVYVKNKKKKQLINSD